MRFTSEYLVVRQYLGDDDDAQAAAKHTVRSPAVVWWGRRLGFTPGRYVRDTRQSRGVHTPGRHERDTLQHTHVQRSASAKWHAPQYVLVASPARGTTQCVSLDGAPPPPALAPPTLPPPATLPP